MSPFPFLSILTYPLNLRKSLNKFDLNYNAVREVEIFCKDNQLKVIGKIPYDLDVTKAMVKGLSAVEFMDNSVSKSIKDVWDVLNSIINKEETL